MTALGAASVSFLISKLHEPKTGWIAARALGELRRPVADPAIQPLIDTMRSDASLPSRAWSARALAQLDQFDALEPLVHSTDATELEVVAEGLKFGRPNSYPMLQRAIDQGAKPLRGVIHRTLAPGSAAFEYRTEQIPLVLDAMRSKHATLRRDAVCNACNVEKRAHKQVLPAVLACLSDSDDPVRRLAVLAIGAMGKRAVQSNLDALRGLERDPESKVRLAVAYVLQRAKIAV